MCQSTCGKILPGIEGKLIDENENIVELGKMGELATKSDFIFQGYLISFYSFSNA